MPNNLATLQEGPITKWTAKRTIPLRDSINFPAAPFRKKGNKKSCLKSSPNVATPEGRGRVAFFAQNVDK